MALRHSLLISAPPGELVDRLEALCVQILREMDGGGDCTPQLSEIEALTGLSYPGGAFFELWGVESERNFAERAALGVAPHVPDIRPDELAEIVNLIRKNPGPVGKYYLDLFTRNVTHPAPSDLIYWPNIYWPKGYEPTAEEIVEKAIASSNVVKL